jgi:hypothetical protein
VLLSKDDALLRYSQVTTLPKAHSTNVETLRRWLQKSIGCVISGSGSNTWGKLTFPFEYPKSPKKPILNLLRNIIWPPNAKANRMDLVVPLPGLPIDQLAYEFVRINPRFCTRRSSSVANVDVEACRPSTTHPEEMIQTISLGWSISAFRSTIITLVACLLPTAAIAILSSIHNTAVLITVIGVFTLMFAIGLIFFTSKKPSRVEVFSATAA